MSELARDFISLVCVDESTATTFVVVVVTVVAVVVVVVVLIGSFVSVIVRQ